MSKKKNNIKMGTTAKKEKSDFSNSISPAIDLTLLNPVINPLFPGAPCNIGIVNFGYGNIANYSPSQLSANGEYLLLSDPGTWTFDISFDNTSGTGAIIAEFSGLASMFNKMLNVAGVQKPNGDIMFTANNGSSDNVILSAFDGTQETNAAIVITASWVPFQVYLINGNSSNK